MPASICADGLTDVNAFDSRSSSMPVSLPGLTSHVQGSRCGSGSFRPMYDGASQTERFPHEIHTISPQTLAGTPIKSVTYTPSMHICSLL